MLCTVTITGHDAEVFSGGIRLTVSSVSLEGLKKATSIQRARSQRSITTYADVHLTVSTSDHGTPPRGA